MAFFSGRFESLYKQIVQGHWEVGLAWGGRSRVSVFLFQIPDVQSFRGFRRIALELQVGESDVEGMAHRAVGGGAAVHGKNRCLLMQIVGYPYFMVFARCKVPAV